MRILQYQVINIYMDNMDNITAHTWTLVLQWHQVTNTHVNNMTAYASTVRFPEGLW